MQDTVAVLRTRIVVHPDHEVRAAHDRAERPDQLGPARKSATGRFGNWLEENKDWALSRDRFWGTPLPVWTCEKCGTQRCVGSIAELKEGENVSEPIDLHKPYVDG